MLYLFDKAISQDLERSFDPEGKGTSIVKVMDSEQLLTVVAALQEDKVKLPVVGVTRDKNISLDSNRMNFTRMHKGQVSVLDPETNNLYYEKVVPVNLGYYLTILTSNTADQDELVRELIFKYIQMYFLSIQLPYEAKRKVRFGVTLDKDMDIDYKSATAEYLSTGELYQAVIHLKCDGCVMVHYTPAKLMRAAAEVHVTDQKPK